MNNNYSSISFKEACDVLPGGVNSPVRAFKSVGLDPVFVKEAQGAILTDEDNNTYIDYIGSWGPMILGHNHPILNKALEEDIIEGKYKEKKGVITFKPNDSKKETKVLYVKDNHLCADPSCKKVYFESDETCSSITAGETEIEE